MFFEEISICKDIYIGDKYADPCEIIIVGNGGMCKIPHFDLVGGDLYCNIPLLSNGFILDSYLRCPGKYTLTLEERIKLNEVLEQPNSLYPNMNNWQVACYEWNSAMPCNEPKIEDMYYDKPSKKPNYAAKNIYFVDNGYWSRIYDDGNFKQRR